MGVLMKTMILYKTKYGSTKEYAQWLAEELQCEMAETETLNAKQLEAYDRIIIGGGILGGGIRGLSWLKKNYSQLCSKQIAVFGVGITPPSEAYIKSLRLQNIGRKFEEIPLFYLRGKWDEKNMTWADHKVCSLMKSNLEKKPEKDLDSSEAALLEVYTLGMDGALDWASKDQLDPIIQWAKG